jgi:hypothetical protein
MRCEEREASFSIMRHIVGGCTRVRTPRDTRGAKAAHLAAAITLATILDASSHMGAAYWIPAFWVPALLVSHWLTFVVLVKHWPAHPEPLTGLG